METGCGLVSGLKAYELVKFGLKGGEAVGFC